MSPDIAGETLGNSWNVNIENLFSFLAWFTPCKAEQPLKVMGLQEKEAQKD